MVQYLRVLCINIVELNVIGCEPLKYHILKRKYSKYASFPFSLKVENHSFTTLSRTIGVLTLCCHNESDDNDNDDDYNDNNGDDHDDDKDGDDDDDDDDGDGDKDDDNDVDDDDGDNDNNDDHDNNNDDGDDDVK